jgi:hypothetical protein
MIVIRGVCNSMTVTTKERPNLYWYTKDYHTTLVPGDFDPTLKEQLQDGDTFEVLALYTSLSVTTYLILRPVQDVVRSECIPTYERVGAMCKSYEIMNLHKGDSLPPGAYQTIALV